jgi:hypothetical protein
MNVDTRFQDELHERRIDEAFNAFLRSRSREEERENYSNFAHLIRMRSPQQVVRMEERMGLR